MLDDKNNKGSYHRSREYRIWWSSANFLNIAGGKLTSFLSMGKKCMDAAEKRMEPLSKPKGEKPEPFQEITIEEILKEDADLAEPMLNGLKLTAAEMVHHIRYLYAQELADIFTRRTSVTYAMKDFDEGSVSKAATIMAKELNKNSEWADMQVKAYHAHWKEYHPDFLNK
jgi:glycerol-3-phosphate dehydrogenase